MAQAPEQVTQILNAAGAGDAQAAEAVGISTRTADRVWAYARSRLHQELNGELAP